MTNFALKSNKKCRKSAEYHFVRGPAIPSYVLLIYKVTETAPRVDSHGQICLADSIRFETWP